MTAELVIIQDAGYPLCAPRPLWLNVSLAADSIAPGSGAGINLPSTVLRNYAQFAAL